MDIPKDDDDDDENKPLPRAKISYVKGVSEEIRRILGQLQKFSAQLADFTKKLSFLIKL